MSEHFDRTARALRRALFNWKIGCATEIVAELEDIAGAEVGGPAFLLPTEVAVELPRMTSGPSGTAVVDPASPSGKLLRRVIRFFDTRQCVVAMQCAVFYSAAVLLPLLCPRLGVPLRGESPVVKAKDAQPVPAAFAEAFPRPARRAFFAAACDSCDDDCVALLVSHHCFDSGDHMPVVIAARRVRNRQLSLATWESIMTASAFFDDIGTLREMTRRVDGAKALLDAYIGRFPSEDFVLQRSESDLGKAEDLPPMATDRVAKAEALDELRARVGPNVVAEIMSYSV